MNTWKVILATILIFGTGVVTGGLLVRRSDVVGAPRQGRLSNTQALTSAGPGVYRLEFLRRAQRELNLSAEQRERVDKVLKQSQERTKTLMEPIAADLRGELDRAKLEFREILNPEQRKRFDDLLKQRFRDPHREKAPRAHDKESPAGPERSPGV